MSNYEVIKSEYGKTDTLIIKDAQIITRFNNFSGTHGYREDSPRSFCVIIDDPELIGYLESQGWNVHTRANPYGDAEDVIRFLQVKVSYRFISPKITVKYPDGSFVNLTEETVDMLDNYRMDGGFEYADVVIKGSLYDGINGSGVSGYLNKLGVIPHFDDFSLKWSNYSNNEDIGD